MKYGTGREILEALQQLSDEDLDKPMIIDGFEDDQMFVGLKPDQYVPNTMRMVLKDHY